MGTVLLWVFCALLAIVAVLFFLIVSNQRKLDKVTEGTIVVEHMPDGSPLVYWDAVKDPGTFTDGETLRLKVKVVK